MCVSDLSVAAMALSCALGAIMPVALFIWYRRRGADVAPFFVGCAVMLLFAFVLESGVNHLVLVREGFAVKYGDSWVYALYVGAMAGIFEETGRFAAFKTVLRKRWGNDRNALMYGAGHGGFEAFVILTLGMAGNLALAAMINSGMGGQLAQGMPLEVAAQVDALAAGLVETPPAVFLLGPVERAIAIALHVSLSVLVWFAAKERRLLWLYPAAIAVHAVVDALAVGAMSLSANPLAIEAAFAAVTSAVALAARRVWKRNAQPDAAEPLPAGGEGRA